MTTTETMLTSKALPETIFEADNVFLHFISLIESDVTGITNLAGTQS
jgi:hypothetical protein